MKFNSDLVSRITDEPVEKIRHERPKDLNLGLGAILKEIRIRKRMKQHQVAAFMGLERTSVANIELGNQLLSLLNLERFAESLGVEVHITFKDKS